jgi:hypothetical protein
MADFTVRIWDNERIYMVDFGRADVSRSVPAAQRRHPHRSCPEVDRVGYMNDAQAAEHGPMVCARVGQGDVRVRFFRTEVSTAARLYAVAANGRTTIRITSPSTGLLPAARSSTIRFQAFAEVCTSF